MCSIKMLSRPDNHHHFSYHQLTKITPTIDCTSGCAIHLQQLAFLYTMRNTSKKHLLTLLLSTAAFQPFNDMSKDDVAITTCTSDLCTIVGPSNVENAASVWLLKCIRPLDKRNTEIYRLTRQNAAIPTTQQVSHSALAG